jgi:hypothetical protein
LLNKYAVENKGEFPKLNTHLIGTKQNPRRLIIAISGFLTENKNPNDQWKNLVMHANSKNIGTYAIGYKCKSKSDTYLYNRASDFGIARAEAKAAGQLLGYVLATRYPFRTQSVSFIGHSLGCQVIKSCLKALHEL